MIWGGADAILIESETEVAQSCPTLGDPMDCSLPSSSVHRIFQARVLEWVAISFSRGSSWPRARTQVSPTVGRRFYCLSHQGSPIAIEICAKSLQSGLTFCVRLLCPWDFPGKNTAVVCHLQGTIHAICLNQPKTMPPPDPQSMGKNGLPWNWSLVPKRLRTIVFKEREVQ